jgi:hypothetical protein
MAPVGAHTTNWETSWNSLQAYSLSNVTGSPLVEASAASLSFLTGPEWLPVSYTTHKNGFPLSVRIVVPRPTRRISKGREASGAMRCAARCYGPIVLRCTAHPRSLQSPRSVSREWRHAPVPLPTSHCLPSAASVPLTLSPPSVPDPCPGQ